MHIKEISRTADDGLDALVELLYQQMIDIGSAKPREIILNAVQNA